MDEREAMDTGQARTGPVSLLRSVAGIAVQGELFFIARRKRDASEMSQRWEFPGGKVESAESDEVALAREFLEEFNAPIRVLRFLGESVFANKGKVRALAAWEIALEPAHVAILNEHSEAAWLPLDTIAGMELADSDRSLIPILQASIRGNR
jgi:8-oxo-dGTP pyrophosphatase MutT (NUDIX family)